MLEIKTTINIGGSATSDIVNVGCSDTLNNITGQELWDNSYVATEFNHVDIVMVDSGLKGPYNSFNPNTYEEYKKYPIYHVSSNVPAGRYYSTKVNITNNTTDEHFLHIIWLCMPLTTNPSRISKNNTNIRVALNFNPHNFKFVINNNNLFRMYKEQNGMRYFTSDEPDKDTIYDDGIFINSTYSPIVQIRQSAETSWRGFGNYKIVPCGIVKIDDKISVFDMTNVLCSSFQSPNVSFRMSNDDSNLYNQCSDGRTLVDYETNEVLAVQMLSLDDTQDRQLFYSRWDWRGGDFVKAIAKNPKIPMGASINRNGSSDWGGGIYYAPLSYGGYLEVLAKYGMIIEGWGSTYKPIITDGVVTGYTDDLTVKSDFDDYKEIVHEGLPDKKPTPPDVDDIESVGYGYFSNTTMGTLYALKNKLDLEKITQWLLTQTEKIDIANNVVSLKEIPFPLSTLGITPIDANLKIGGTDVTYQGENVVVGEIVAPTIPTLSVVFADFNIPRLSGTFLDYSPYTKYELLVPFAPSPISLPDWCVNKNVKAIFLYDIYTTACQYVIECNGERICSVSGNFGIDRPISAQNVALKDSARLSAQIGTASSVLGGVMSGATGNVGGIISGAVGGVSALSQMILSGKQNYMYTVGANGDSSTVGLYHAAHLKITRTLSAEDENFVHVYGKPLCKVRKLSSLSGYTKCDNVNTSGLTCSESEKQMIKNLLESGVHI